MANVLITCKFKKQLFRIKFFRVIFIILPILDNRGYSAPIDRGKSSFIAGTFRLCYNDAHKIEQER